MKEKHLLIELRSKLVGQMHVQPFTIYNDATIDALIEAKPKTIAELEKVKGFPKNGKRIVGFGDAIIAIFTGKEVKGYSVTTDKSGQVSVKTELKRMEAF